MKNISKKIISLLCLLMAVLMMMSLAACKDNIDDTGSSADEGALSYSADSADTSADTQASDTSATEATTVPATSEPVTEATKAVQSTTVPKSVNSDGVEIIGAGSKSQPYLETPNSSMKVTTAKVPAGKALYYDIYRVGGKRLTINDSSAYVIYNGTRYNSSGGKVSFVVGSALASDAVSFQIGNSGSTAKSFVISFSDVYGSYDNPEIISKMDGKEITVSLAAGNDKGYNYKYTAEKTGTIRFYVKNDLNKFLFSATRNMNSDGMSIPVQHTFVDEVKTDSNGNYIELEVIKGETVMIAVSAYPTGAYYPAVTVKWYGIYSN